MRTLGRICHAKLNRYLALAVLGILLANVFRSVAALVEAYSSDPVGTVRRETVCRA
jgi:hypothetical protein